MYCSVSRQRLLTTATLFSLVFGAIPGAVTQSTCTVSANSGSTDTTFNAMATQNGPGTGNEPSGSPGWTGADSTYSILLPNGNTAFFYSDSYIGQSPALSGDGTVTTNANGLRTRAVNCSPPLCSPATNVYRAHNSIVVRNATSGQLTSLTGAVDAYGYSTSYFVPSNTNHFYWMGDSVVVQTTSSGTKKVWTFLLEFDSSWTYYGSAIAQLSLPSLAIESITPLTNIPSGNTTNWGSSMWLDGSYGNYYLYIYGINGSKPYVALTNPALGVSGVANTSSNWYVAQHASSGWSWVTGLNNASPVIGDTSDPNNAGDMLSNEFSVKKVTSSAGTTYLLVAEDTKPAYGTQTDIVLYSACSPYGPFSAKDVVYSTPETGTKTVPGMTSGQQLTGTLLTYNAHSHPQFTSSGSLLISYDLNTSNSADLIYADTYRPKFIRVPIAGLH